MSHCLIELHYLPNVQYFATLAQHKIVTLERHEHFIKQSYRNRCLINTSQGSQTLSIPLISNHGKQIISDIKIDYSQKWLNNHWRGIQSAYAKAPFFEFYADALHDTLFAKHPHLFELNRALLTLCLKWMKLTIEIEESLAYEKNPSVHVLDLRNAISAKKIGFADSNLSFKPYTQVFGNAFVDNLSIIDLIFCTGPQALTYLQKAE